jgi:hypothetical protein
VIPCATGVDVDSFAASHTRGGLESVYSSAVGLRRVETRATLHLNEVCREAVKIGEPERTYTVEPLEDPVPREPPAEPAESPAEPSPAEEPVEPERAPPR